MVWISRDINIYLQNSIGCTPTIFLTALFVRGYSIFWMGVKVAVLNEIIVNKDNGSD